MLIRLGFIDVYCLWHGMYFGLKIIRTESTNTLKIYVSGVRESQVNIHAILPVFFLKKFFYSFFF